MLMYNQQQLKELWDQFANIPIDNNDDTESSFLHFPAGTDKLEIWQWFDNNYPSGVIGLSSN